MAFRSILRAQTPIRLRGKLSCAYHHGIEVTYCCKKCSELACIRCIASVHDGHVLESLDDVIPLKKDEIRSFIERVEEKDLKELKSEIASIDDKIKNNGSTFQIHEQAIHRQYNRIKEELDFVVKNLLSKCRQLEKENVDRLKAYKREMEERIKMLEMQIQECKEVIESGTSAQIFDNEKAIDTWSKIELDLCTMSLTPNKYPMGYLELAIGKLTTFGYRFVNSIKLNELSVDHNSNQLSVSVDEHIPETTVVREMKSILYSVSSICADKNGGAWICDANVDTVAYYTQDDMGTLFRYFNKRINNVCVSQKTDVLWATSEDGNEILELTSNKKPVVRFKTDSKPMCLFVTWLNNILVGMVNKISSYTPAGTTVILTDAPDRARVRTPVKVAECVITRRIAVVDLDAFRDGGKCCPHVLIMDEMFKETFRYKGKENANLGTETSLFNPCDVGFDSGGNIVIGDNGEKCIVLLSGKGEFVATLYTDSWDIVGLGVNNKDEIWAAFNYRHYPNYKIKLLKKMS